MEIWDYFWRKEREFRDYSVVPDRQMFEAEEGDNRRGVIFGHLHLEDDVYLKVYERVVIRGAVPYREVYAYVLIIRGKHAYRWERDPTHADCPVHEHEGLDEIRKEGVPPTALSQALERAWVILSSRAVAWSPPENDDA